MFSDLACFARQAMDQITANAAFGENAGAVGGDPDQITRPVFINPLECVKNCRDEDGASIVRFNVVYVIERAWLQRHPFAFLVPAANHTAKSAPVAFQRLAELRGQFA